MAVVNQKQSARVEAASDRLDLSFLVPAEWLPWVRVAIILWALTRLRAGVPDGEAVRSME
jgi:hypothetical protein